MPAYRMRDSGPSSLSPTALDGNPRKSALDLFGITPEGRAAFGPRLATSGGNDAPYRYGFQTRTLKSESAEGILDSLTRERGVDRSRPAGLTAASPVPHQPVALIRNMPRGSSASSSTMSSCSSDSSSQITMSAFSGLSSSSFDASQPKTSSASLAHERKSLARLPHILQWSHFVAKAPLLDIVKGIELCFSKRSLTYYCRRSEKIALKWEFRAIFTKGTVSVYDSERVGTFIVEVCADEGGEDVEVEILRMIEATLKTSVSSSGSGAAEAMAEADDAVAIGRGPASISNENSMRSKDLTSSSSSSSSASCLDTCPVMLSSETTLMFVDSLHRGVAASRLFTLRALVDLANNPTCHTSLIPFLVPMGNIMVTDLPVADLSKSPYVENAVAPLLLAISYVYEKVTKTSVCVEQFCASNESNAIIERMLQAIWLPSQSPILILTLRNIASALCTLAVCSKPKVVQLITSSEVQHLFTDLSPPLIDSTVQGLRDTLKRLLL